MFKSRWRKKAESLETENGSLRQELADLRASPEYRVGVDLTTEVNAVQADPDSTEMKNARETAIAEKRSELVKARIAQIVGGEVAGLLAARRDEIEAEARTAAARLAQKVVGRFVAEESPEGEERPAQRRSAIGVSLAWLQILKEEGVLQVNRDMTTARDYRQLTKIRAKEIRERTKHTNALSLGDLMVDDSITLGFTVHGGGHERLTMEDWNRSYNSGLETRRLTFRLTDPENGIGQVEADSWFDDDERRNASFRAGREVSIHTIDPDFRDSPATLVKGSGIALQDADGSILNDLQVSELWWADLGEFRMLS